MYKEIDTYGNKGCTYIVTNWKREKVQCSGWIRTSYIVADERGKIHNCDYLCDKHIELKYKS